MHQLANSSERKRVAGVSGFDDQFHCFDGETPFALTEEESVDHVMDFGLEAEEWNRSHDDDRLTVISGGNVRTSGAWWWWRWSSKTTLGDCVRVLVAMEATAGLVPRPVSIRNALRPNT